MFLMQYKFHLNKFNYDPPTVAICYHLWNVRYWS